VSAAFFWNDRIAAAPYVGDYAGAATAGLPLSNILDPQPRLRARWVPATAAVYVDLGASYEIACVALISTTFGLAGGSPTVQVLVSEDAGFGAPTWDTGALDPTTSAAAGGNVVLVHPTSVTGRFLLITMADAAAASLDVGRIVAGPLWRPTYGASYGMAEGRMVLDRRDTNGFTGAQFPVPAVLNPRMVEFTLGAVTPAEAIGEWRTMLATLGGTGDALWIPDDGLSLSEMNLRSIWGGIAEPGSSATITRANFRLHQRGFRIVERT
jgi:hypothetical protein